MTTAEISGRGFSVDTYHTTIDIVVDTLVKSFVGYLATRILTTINPFAGAIFTATAHLVRLVTGPLFHHFFKEYYVSKVVRTFVILESAFLMVQVLGFAQSTPWFGVLVVSIVGNAILKFIEN